MLTWRNSSALRLAWPEKTVGGGGISPLSEQEIQEDQEETAASEKSLKDSQRKKLNVVLHLD